MAEETRNNSHGYTLFEILIVMAILGVILGIGAINYNSYTKKQVITQEGLTLKDALRNAATNASSGQKPVGITCTHLLGYQVSFTANTYSTQAMCDPDAPDAPTHTVTLNPLISFNPVPASILFRVLNRGVITSPIHTASQSASLTLTSVDNSRSFLMSIGSDGSVSIIGLQ